MDRLHMDMDRLPTTSAAASSGSQTTAFGVTNQKELELCQ